MSSSAAAAPAQSRKLARLRAARDALLGVRPLYVVGALVGAQWLALVVFALIVRHNGWLYYAGGDQLWHYSGAYLLAHGQLPPTYVGYGWSVVLAPLAAVAGPNIVSALPAIVLLNALVLLPVALICVYAIAARIAGRLFGYWSAALWIAVPYATIFFVGSRYHQKYTELTLPQLLGLSSVPDFPSTVALLVAAYFCLRALDAPSWHAAAAAGLAAGYSIAIKPSNALFLFAPILLFLVSRRSAVIPFAAALAPALLTLALWKFRGLGQLASVPPEAIRLAGAGDLARRVYQPDLNTWSHLHQVLLGLREHFWIARLIEWLPLAGSAALAIRSARALYLIGPWFFTYLFVKGTYEPASIDDASIFRILMPAFPAYVLLAAAVVLLVPGVRLRRASAGRPGSPRRARIVLALAGALFVAAPLGVVAAARPLHGSGEEAVRLGSTLIPVSDAVGLQASVEGGAVRLTWRARPAGMARVFYRVLRAPSASAGPFCAGEPRTKADDCVASVEPIASVRETELIDRPGPGSWTYRIGVAANWLDDPELGDVTVLGNAVAVDVG